MVPVAVTVKELAPVINCPLFSASVPLRVALALSVTPAGLLLVRLFNTVVLTGSSDPVVVGLTSLYVTLIDVPKVGVRERLPAAREMAALLPRVSVPPPLLSTPLVKMSVPLLV